MIVSPVLDELKEAPSKNVEFTLNLGLTSLGVSSVSSIPGEGRINEDSENKLNKYLLKLCVRHSSE